MDGEEFEVDFSVTDAAGNPVTRDSMGIGYSAEGSRPRVGPDGERLPPGPSMEAGARGVQSPRTVGFDPNAEATAASAAPAANYSPDPAVPQPGGAPMSTPDGGGAAPGGAPMSTPGGGQYQGQTQADLPAYHITQQWQGPTRAQRRRFADLQGQDQANADAISRTYLEQEAVARRRGGLAERTGTEEREMRMRGLDAVDQINAIKDAEKQEIDAELRRVKGRYDRAIRDLRAREISPDNWWHSRETPQKMLSIVGLFLGSLGQARGLDTNPALDLIERAIERDVDAQVANVNKDIQAAGLDFNLMGFLRQQGLDIEEARKAAIEQAYRRVEEQVKGLQAEAAGTDRAQALEHLAQGIERERLGVQGERIEAQLAAARRAMAGRETYTIHVANPGSRDPRTGNPGVLSLRVSRKTAEKFLENRVAAAEEGAIGLQRDTNNQLLSRDTRLMESGMAPGGEGALMSVPIGSEATERQYVTRVQNMMPLSQTLSSLGRMAEAGLLDEDALDWGGLSRFTEVMVGGTRGEYLARTLLGENAQNAQTLFKAAIDEYSKLVSGAQMSDAERQNRLNRLIGLGSPREVMLSMAFLAERTLGARRNLESHPRLGGSATAAFEGADFEGVERLVRALRERAGSGGPSAAALQILTAPVGTYEPRGPAPQAVDQAP